MLHTTDPQDEVFDVIDENDRVIGQATRMEVHRKKLLHREVSILVFKNGKIYLQKRSLTKDTDPGFWTASCSGHVNSGEKQEDAAVRELKEELGLQVKKEDLKFLGKEILRTKNEIVMMTYYKIETNQEIKPDPVEIEEGRFFKPDRAFFDEFENKKEITTNLQNVITKYLKD